MFYKKLNTSELIFEPRGTEAKSTAAFGCSSTYGMGVEYEQTFAYQLNAYNVGQPGSSNDRICRLAIEYINTYCPEKIYVFWTFDTRREWINSNGDAIRFIPGHTRYGGEFWHKAHVQLGNPDNNEYNYCRNKLMLETYCELKNVKLRQLAYSEFPTHTYPLGTDDQHPGPLWHDWITREFQKQDKEKI